MVTIEWSIFCLQLESLILKSLPFHSCLEHLAISYSTNFERFTAVIMTNWFILVQLQQLVNSESWTFLQVFGLSLVFLKIFSLLYGSIGSFNFDLQKNPCSNPKKGHHEASFRFVLMFFYVLSWSYYHFLKDHVATFRVYSYCIFQFHFFATLAVAVVVTIRLSKVSGLISKSIISFGFMLLHSTLKSIQ